jgi:hypothetical protein
LGIFLVLLALGAVSARGEEALRRPEGVALGIVYDTSGSMRESVMASSGKQLPKYQIASRVLAQIVDRLERFAGEAAASSDRRLEVGLFTFDASRAKAVVPLAPFDSVALKSWLTRFTAPNGPTPLGESLKLVGSTLLRSKLPQKHVLLVTDGVNTTGQDPVKAVTDLLAQAKTKGDILSFHIVAFDVEAKVFEGLKRLGATVVEAGNEQELNSKLEFILRRKILLEDEEPPVRVAPKG